MNSQPQDAPASAATAHAAVHLSGYQARDHEVVDYDMTELPGTGLIFRGPLPRSLDQPGSYFACIGAAQTLGCFCEKPFPTLMADALGLPALNLGYGGAGPEFFLAQKALLPYLNRARFVVMQVMSARSQSNSLYECGGLEFVTLRADGRGLGAHAAWDEMLQGPRALHHLPLPQRVRRKLGNWVARPRARSLIAEAREGFHQASLDLLAKIEVPVILCWFSKRAPAYRQLYGTGSILGEFPHLVTAEMIAELAPHVEAYVECVTRRGSPQPLVSRFSGEPVSVNPSHDRVDLGGRIWRENTYYPSPEMHEDAANGILQVLHRSPDLHIGGRDRPRAVYATSRSSSYAR